GALLRLAIGATPFLVPLLLQTALGWSPLKSGAVIASMMAGSLLARLGGTYVIRTMGFRRALVVTTALTAVFTAAPALVDADTSWILVAGARLAAGFSRAAHYVAQGAIAFAEVTSDQVSRASTLSTVIQQISLSLGISLAGFTLFLSAGQSNALEP